MNKGLKIAGVVVAIVVALFALLVVIAKIVITPERVKNTVVPLAEKALHRQVRLGEIQVSIFSGILVKNVQIMEKEGNEAFVAAEQAKLRYQFWPLLSRRIVVDEVRLDAPRIRVVRLPDGSFNYSDMLTKKEPAAPTTPEPRREIDLLISKVGLSRGEVRYEERKEGVAPFTYTVNGIEVNARDISPHLAFPFSVRAKIPGVGFEMEGKITEAATKPTIDAVARMADVDLQKMTAGLPPAVAAKANPFEPAGVISVTLHLAGPTQTPKELLKDGKVRLDHVLLTASGQRTALSGDLVLKGTALSSTNLALTLGQNRADVDFTVENLLAKPLVVASAISSERFDLDPFLKKGAKPAAATGAEEKKTEAGPLNLPLRATGTVKLGQTSYKGLALTGLALKYRLAENVLTIEELKGSVAGGTFTDTARIDLGQKGFSYTNRLSLQGVQATPIVAAFAPKASDTVFGTLSLNADLSGRGMGAAMKKNLGGKGDFTITDGKITGAGLVQGLAAFINLEQLRVLQFSRFAGGFRMANGKVILDSTVAGKDLQMTPKGTAGLDQSLDLSLSTRLSPELTAKAGARGQLGSLLVDNQGWGLVPLKVTGTFTAPKFRLDQALVREQVTTKAKEKLQKTIEEKLLKRKEGESRKPEQELLEKGIRGIFGR